MPPIGETLRDARMRQNLDIADVESYTKIRAKYLRALENEEWGALPGPTFVRTFLRTYAEAVGIDPHPLVDEYRQRYEPVDEPEPPPRAARTSGGASRRVPRPPRAPGPPGPLALIGGVVALIVVVLLVLGLVGGDDNGSPDSAARTTPATTTTPKAKPRRTRTTPRRTPSGVTVRIAPAVPTYACLDSGDGTDRVFEGILSEARTFKNAKELRINLGKRQVTITANGKKVQVPPSADPYGLRVTPKATAEITDGPRPCA